MGTIPHGLVQDAERLGILAMKFRAARRDSERRDIAKEYSQAVERLINSGCWQEMPLFEDQLPDDWMPQAFFDYWLPRSTP
jgi:hypothetical protein